MEFRVLWNPSKGKGWVLQEEGQWLIEQAWASGLGASGKLPDLPEHASVSLGKMDATPQREMIIMRHDGSVNQCYGGSFAL